MKFNYTIPEIRKLCKRGSNSRLVLWLQGFGDKFYTKGQADGVGGTLSGILNMIQDGKTLDQIETEIEQGLRILNGPTINSNHDSRKRGDDNGPSQGNPSQGIDAGDPDSSETGTDGSPTGDTTP